MLVTDDIYERWQRENPESPKLRRLSTRIQINVVLSRSKTRLD